MIDSRRILDLHPRVHRLADAHLARCKAAGITLIVTSTYRDNEAQDALYALGRTTAGKIRTNARGGESWHQYRLAYDVVPLRFGKPVWGDKGDDALLWHKVGEIGKSVGLEWAGDWRRFREMPHFQFTGGLTIADLQAGKRLEDVT